MVGEWNGLRHSVCYIRSIVCFWVVGWVMDNWTQLNDHASFFRAHGIPNWHRNTVSRNYVIDNWSNFIFKEGGQKPCLSCLEFNIRTPTPKSRESSKNHPKSLSLQEHPSICVSFLSQGPFCGQKSPRSFSLPNIPDETHVTCVEDMEDEPSQAPWN